MNASDCPQPDSPASVPQNVTIRKVSSGFGWSAAEMITRIIVRMASLAILARFLRPVDFGLFAAAMTAWELVRPFSSLCLEQALVQRQDLDSNDVTSAWLLAAGTCTATTLLLAFGAKWVAMVYSVPQLTPVLFWLAFSIPFRCVGTMALTRFQRNLDFRIQALVSFGSNTLSAIASVAGAMNGLGIWSLVLGHYIELGVPALTLGYGLLRSKWSWPNFGRRWRPLVSYGATQSLGLFLNYWALNGDYLVLGRLLGPKSLGYYSRAYQLMAIVPSLLGTVHTSILFPGFSRIQNQRDRIANILRESIEGVSTIAFPATMASVVVAPELITLVLGDGWNDVIVPFRILAAGIYMRTAYRLLSSILMAIGKVRVLTISQGVYAVLIVVGAYVGAHSGKIIGVAIATILALTVFFVLLSIYACRHVGLPLRSLIWAHRFGIITLSIPCLSAIMTLVVVPNRAEHPIGFLATFVGSSAVIGALATRQLKARLWGPRLYQVGSSLLSTVFRRGRP